MQKKLGVFSAACAFFVLMVGFLILWMNASKNEPPLEKYSMQCGHWALLRSCQLLGVPISGHTLTELLPERSDGHSLLELKNSLEKVGLNVQAESLSLEDALKRRGPAILHLKNPDHFVVMNKLSNGKAIIFDSVGRRKTFAIRLLKERFTGYSLFVSRNQEISLPINANRDLAKNPSIQFDTLYIDHGDVPYNAPNIEFSFKVRNFGKQNLIIKKLSADCGCIDVSGPEFVAPGESAAILAKFQHTPNPRSAAFEHEIFVTTNDPIMEFVTLLAAGNTDVRIAPSPSNLDFGRQKKGGRQTRRVFVQSNGDDDTTLQSASFECTFPDTELRVLTREEFSSINPIQFTYSSEIRLRGDVRIVEICWSPKPEAAIESVHGSLRISVLNDLLPAVEVPITGVLLAE